jgi:RNA polymerase sigma-70 factor (ECF subfamily)
MHKNEDRELIKRAQQGDAGAFETLANGYYETMFKMAYKFCGNRQDAEDITQEACIKLARNIGSFRHDSAFTSWLYRLTINTAKDWYKSSNRHPGSEEGMDTAQVKEIGEDQLYAKQVIAALNKLPEGERDAVLLVLSEGLSHKEAGIILECKESTISWRIHEARKKLGALFEKEQKYG